MYVLEYQYCAPDGDGHYPKRVLSFNTLDEIFYELIYHYYLENEGRYHSPATFRVYKVKKFRDFFFKKILMNFDIYKATDEKIAYEKKNKIWS